MTSPTEGFRKVRSDIDPAEETRNTSRKEQKRFLSHREAQAGGPADSAACGEEDPGVALELMVEDFDEKKANNLP